MAIEKTVSELAEILGVSRQAINNRVKALPPEDTEKNEKGVTVVTRSGLIKLEEIYKKTIFEDEPVSEEVKQRELMEILVDEKNAEIFKKYQELAQKEENVIFGGRLADYKYYDMHNVMERALEVVKEEFDK